MSACRRRIFRLNGRRRLSWPPMTIGLTGSIGMGKSTVAQMVRRMGISVFDADAEVHRLMGPDGLALPALKNRFPKVVGPRGVDRQTLGQEVFGNTAALHDLESILHPLVRKRRQAFLRANSLRRARCVLLDIPLLLESSGPPSCDKILVVSAPSFLQRDRVLKRPGMTDEKFSNILARQLPDLEKRRKADRVIFSGMGKRFTWRMLNRFLKRQVLRTSNISKHIL